MRKNIDGKQAQIFCDFLKKEYIKKLSGEADEDEYIVGESPANRIMLGLLDSGDKSELQDLDTNKRFEKMNLLKVSFYLNPKSTGKLHINLKGTLFYNIKPQYSEQKIDELTKPKEEQEINVDIVNKFKRIKIDETMNDLIVDVNELIKTGRVDLSSEVNNRLLNINIEDSIYYKDTLKIPTASLINEQEFENYLKKSEMLINTRPAWQFNVIVECKKSSVPEQLIATLIVINKTPKSQDFVKSKDEMKLHPTPLYNVGVEIIGENVEFQNNRLSYFSDTYKVDQNTKAKGEWIAAEFDETNNKIYTTNVPEYIEYRRKTNDTYNKYITFDTLINEPVNNLKEIYNAMTEYVIKMGSVDIPLSAKEEYARDISMFNNEIKKFKVGIDIIEDYPKIRKAFECMNKTFMLNKKYNSWRLFQIVYIVSMIPDIVYNEHADELKNIYDYNYQEETGILYYPTGGGKTEAFLGCATFAMFYERLMGKEYGVSSIIKYPLRLLSIQQLERTLKVIMQANKIAEDVVELKGKEKFSLGYFVGSTNTPNYIKETEKQDVVKKPEYRLISKCPECGEEIALRYDDKSKTLQHFCNKCGKALPLYIVDDDIYRFLPTIIISIVDKLTQISYSDSFKNILGAPGYRCKKHGFSHNKKCACDVNCDMEDVAKNSSISLAPTLFIQDELHLLKESLGAFTSHYEGFCKYYIKELLPVKHRKRIKYIGATATVSGANLLIENLYKEKARVFPCGLTDSNNGNFYSYIDKQDISRRIIGFSPHGRSVSAGMEYSVTVLRKILYSMYTEPEKYMQEIDGLNVSEDEFKAIIFFYWTSIVYFNSKNDNNKLRNTFDQQANIEHLVDIPEARFNMIKMTGDEDFNAIKDGLSAIENEENKMKAYNLILATSTISHGVDEDEFNNIFFYGMPSNMAEYIQAYSRVGRKYEGLVIDIIRLARQRDVSYLNFFGMFHKYKDYLIDDVPINSLAINAMKHTLPGIFVGLVKQYYSARDNVDYSGIGVFEEGRESGKINVDEMYKHLLKIYNTNILTSDNMKNEYEKEIKHELISILKGMSSLKNRVRKNEDMKNHMEEVTSIHTKVMSSLRDVDDTVNIAIMFDGGNNEKE